MHIHTGVQLVAIGSCRRLTHVMISSLANLHTLAPARAKPAVCVCVCVHVYICVCVCVCVYACACVFVCMWYVNCNYNEVKKIVWYKCAVCITWYALLLISYCEIYAAY